MAPILPLAIDLPAERQRDLVRSLHRQLQGAILDGRLQPGFRMPPTRALATELGISRNSVVSAFDLLFSQGYLVARQGSGTFVADHLPVRPVDAARGDVARMAGRLNSYWQQRMAAPGPVLPGPRRFDFRVGLPDHHLFPHETWRRLASTAMRSLAREEADYADTAGRRELRQAIAAYVSFARAIACDEADVVVTNGAQHAFDLIARILVEPGVTRVAVEDPGYPPAREAFAAAGARLVTVPMDDEGLRVDCIPADVGVIVTTPSHQFPLGTVMSQRRRAELLDFAHERGIAVVEDDYDGEFRFNGRPLDALRTVDERHAVFYVGTFSKSLFPALRLGYIVPPSWAIPALIGAKRLSNGHNPSLEQVTLAAFIRDGHLARHVRKARRVYGERRAALEHAIVRHGNEWLSPIRTDVGLHMAARLRDGIPADTVVAAAATRGVAVDSLGAYQLEGRCAGLMFGIGMIRIEDVEQGVRELCGAIAEVSNEAG
ncbi:PLP-dependent aminotransferase family protein [Luteibacter sp.]|jgi:GntR family transcriptional regulator/MocR family aminotransferase|uniref:MocR-like pyridoxine biosynthesis transcription factor PdxR n=1 Tax=Luteibacter sp. TaxID=1886636 RepID=UPI002F4265BD